jgi:hypothetical protein
MTRRPAALRLVEHMGELVAGARGNVVSIGLRSALKALGAESRAEAAAVKAALDALASLGLLEAVPSRRKPRYVLRRGSLLWAALEAGRAEQVAELASAAADKCLRPKRRKRR